MDPQPRQAQEHRWWHRADFAYFVVAYSHIAMLAALGGEVGHAVLELAMAGSYVWLAVIHHRHPH